MRDALSDLSISLLRQATEPNIYGYKPHPKQDIFHKAGSYGRWFLGGNRSGKSVAGVVEDIWWATKRHPHFQIPEHVQIRGRVVGSDFTNGIETILFPIFKRWILPSDLIGGSWEDSYDKSERTLTFTDGSFIEFRSCDQELVKHAGTSRHFIHFDEEPPKAFFEENMMRLIDTGFGRWWITMTPVEGMTWMYDDIYEPFENGETSSELLSIVEVEMADNPHLKMEEREKALGFLGADSRKKREKGSFVSRGGRVLSDFSESTHSRKLAGWRPPDDWIIYTSLDYGWRNPTAVGWHAVRPDGRKVVTFHEFYQDHTLIRDIAQIMLRFEAENNLKIYFRTGDPSMRTVDGKTGTSTLFEYGKYGIVMAVEGVPKNESIGIERMTDYLQIDPKTGEPFWEITRECPHHIKEFKRLSWRTYATPKLDGRVNPVEKVEDKDNHAFDEAKYFFTFMSELGSGETQPEALKFANGSYMDTLYKMSQEPDDAESPIKWDIQESFPLDNYGVGDWNYGD